jgi:streptogramin lyase
MRPGAYVLCLAACLAFAAPAGAVKITEFPVEAGSGRGVHRPYYIVPATDGTLWYTDTGTAGAVRQMSLQGEALASVAARLPVTLAFDPARNLYWVKAIPAPDHGFTDLAQRTPTGVLDARGAYDRGYSVGVDQDGMLAWTQVFNDSNGSSVGTVCRTTGLHASAACKVVSANALRLTSLTADLDGRLWVASPDTDQLFRMPPGADADLTVTFPHGATPARVALGPDGNMWVTAYGLDRIYRITPSTGFQAPPYQLPQGRGPNDITLGPDGALWFTEDKSSSIGRLTTDGQYSSYPVSTAGARPIALTTGADGAIWFTEFEAGNIGRLELDKAGSGGGPSGGGGGGVVDRVAPRFVQALSFSNTRFRAGSKSTALSARAKPAPIGTTMRFTLSEPATVSIAIQRKSRGRRAGGKCKAPTKARRHKRRCTRWLTRGTLTRKAIGAPAAYPFSARIRGRALAAGGYRAVARAKDTAGNRSGKQSARFTVVPR